MAKKQTRRYSDSDLDGVLPSDWQPRIDAAEKFTERHREELVELERQYLGAGGSNRDKAAISGKLDDAGGLSSGHDHEPFAFGQAAWILPQLVWDNPKVDLSSPVNPDEATAIEHAGNNWIVASGFRETLIPLALDHALLWGIAVVGASPRHGVGNSMKAAGMPLAADSVLHTVPPVWPWVERVAQTDYFVDSAAKSVTSARFQGHRWVRPADEVYEMAAEDDTWADMDVLESATRSLAGSNNYENRDDLYPQDVIEAQDIWAPGFVLPNSPGREKGYHGTMFTLGKCGGSGGDGDAERWRYLRDPRPYYGDPTGPYQHFGVHAVPNTPFSMSALVPMLPSVRSLNGLLRRAIVADESFKQGVIHDLKDTKALQEMEQKPDLFIQGIKNLFQNGKPLAVPMKWGGSSPEQREAIAGLRNLIADYTGQTDMQRGVASDVPATNAAIAEGNADVRVQWVRSRWEDAVTGLLRKVFWRIAVDDEVVVPINPSISAERGGEGAAFYMGGGITPADFEQSYLRIAPFSMERTDEATRGRRVMDTFQLMTTILPLAQQFPMVPWADWVDWLGDGLNMPELGRLLPAEALAMVPGAPVQPATPTPRLSKDAAPRNIGGGGGHLGASTGQAAAGMRQGPQPGQPPTIGTGALG